MVVSSNRSRVLTPKGVGYNLSGGIWETSPLAPKNITETPATTTVVVHGEEDRENPQIPMNTNKDDRSIGSTSCHDDENYPDDDDDEDTLVSLDLERIEHLLSQRLLNGYCLLEKACPSCSVPLIKLPINADSKAYVSNPKGNKSYEDYMTTPKRMEASNGSYHYISYSIENNSKVQTGSNENGNVSSPNQPSIEVRSLDTFDLSGTSNAPIVPIAGVPFCVYCEAHVITNDVEVAIIEEMASAIDARQSGQVFVGACDATNSITTDLLEATRQQLDENNINCAGTVQDPDADPKTDGIDDCSPFVAKDPTPRRNGTFFTSASAGKSFSLSPRRKKGIPPHPNSFAMTKHTNTMQNTPARSKSYSPQMKRKGVSEPFFFASYDDASRRTNDDYCGGDDRFSHMPSFFEESSHRRSFLWPEGTTLTSMRNKANQIFPEGRKLNSSTNAGEDVNKRTSKLEPPSPVVVVLSKEQISNQPNTAVPEHDEQGSLQPPPVVRATTSVAVPTRVKRDPEPSQSGEETDIDPIIIITSNEQYTVNDAGETVKKERPNSVPSELPQQQQKRSYTNHQVTVPSVEIPVPQDMNFDEISTLAHTYDEGSPPHNHHHHGCATTTQHLDYMSSKKVDHRSINASVKPNQPRFGNNIKSDSDEDDGMMDFPMPEYEIRRDIATKVLGAKMMIGYGLKEELCRKCNMPMMVKNTDSKLECVVCPALYRKAIREKKLAEQREKLAAEMAKQQQQLREKFEFELKEAERQREKLEEEMALAQQRQRLEKEFLKEQLEQQRKLEKEIKRVEEQRLKLEEERRVAEQHLKLEHEMMEQKQRVFPPKSTKDIQLSNDKLDNNHANSISNEKSNASSFKGGSVPPRRPPVSNPHQPVGLQCVKGKDVIEPLTHRPMSALGSQSLGETTISSKPWTAFQTFGRAHGNKQDQSLTDDDKAAKSPLFHLQSLINDKHIVSNNSNDNTKSTESNLLQPSRDHGTTEVVSRIEGTISDQSFVTSPEQRSAQWHTLEENESKLERDLSAAIEARSNAEAEVQRLADEKKALDKASLLVLEEEFIAKQKEAHEALNKATDTLSRIRSTRAKLGEKPQNRSISVDDEDSEDDEDDQPSNTVQTVRWSILRAEARSVMTKRMMNRWSILPEFCKGSECDSAPLMFDGAIKQCVICNGSGSGNDGLYAEENDNESTKAPLLDVHKSLSMSSTAEIWRSTSLTSASVKTMSLKELQLDFDTKRSMVSKEIKERMKKGWTLLDLICPNCVMPLMTDTKGKNEICVLCGLIGRDIGTKSLDDDEKRFKTRQQRTVNQKAKVETYKKNRSGKTSTVDTKNAKNVPKDVKKSKSGKPEDIDNDTHKNVRATPENEPPVKQSDSTNVSASTKEDNPPLDNQYTSDAKVNNSESKTSEVAESLPKESPAECATSPIDPVIAAEANESFSLINTLRERFSKQGTGNDPPAERQGAPNTKKKAIDPPNSPVMLIKSWFSQSRSIDPEESKNEELGNNQKEDMKEILELPSKTSAQGNSAEDGEATNSTKLCDDEVDPTSVGPPSTTNDESNVETTILHPTLRPPLPPSAMSVTGSEKMPINVDNVEANVKGQQVYSPTGSEFSPIDVSSSSFSRSISPLGNRSPSVSATFHRERNATKSQPQNKKKGKAGSKGRTSRRHNSITDDEDDDPSATSSQFQLKSKLSRGRSKAARIHSTKAIGHRNRSLSIESSTNYSNTPGNMKHTNTISRRSRSYSNTSRARSVGTNQSISPKQESHFRKSTNSDEPYYSDASQSSGSDGCFLRSKTQTHSITNRKDGSIRRVSSRSGNKNSRRKSDGQIKHVRSGSKLVTTKRNERSLTSRDNTSRSKNAANPNSLDKRNSGNTRRQPRRKEQYNENAILSNRSIEDNDGEDEKSYASENRDPEDDVLSKSSMVISDEESQVVDEDDFFAYEDDQGDIYSDHHQNHQSEHSNLLTLEMPKGFNAQSDDQRNGNKASNSRSSLKVDTSSAQTGGRREPSPGMSVASLPLYFPSPSSNAASTRHGIVASTPKSIASPYSNTGSATFRGHPKSSSSGVIDASPSPSSIADSNKFRGQRNNVHSLHVYSSVTGSSAHPSPASAVTSSYNFHSKSRRPRIIPETAPHRNRRQHTTSLRIRGPASLQSDSPSTQFDNGKQYISRRVERVNKRGEAGSIKDPIKADEENRTSSSGSNNKMTVHYSFPSAMQMRNTETPMSYSSTASEFPPYSNNSSSYGYGYKDARHLASPGLQPMSVPTIPSHSESTPSYRIHSSASSSSNIRSTPESFDHDFNAGATMNQQSRLSKDAIVHLHSEAPTTTKTIADIGKEVIVIGDDFDAELDAMAHDARSVGSDTIDGLLNRIEKTKSQIEQTKEESDGAASQARLRNLIDNLAMAAEQMQKYDNL